MKFSKSLLDKIHKFYQSLLNSIYLLKIVADFSKPYLVLYVIMTIVDGLFPLAGLYFPKLLIDIVQTSQDFSQLVKLTLIFISVVIIYNLFTHLIRGKYLQLKSDMLHNHFALKLNSKIASLDLKYLETPIVFDTLEKAGRIGEGEVTKCIHAFFSSVSQILTLLSVTIILSRLSITIVVIAVVVVAINAILNSRSKKIEVETFNELAPARRKLGYHMNVLKESRFAKELRIYNFGDWVVSKVNTIMVHFSSSMGKTYWKMHRNHLLSSLSGNMQELVMYLLLGYQAITGRITVGDFVLYLNAVSRFSASLNQIAWNFIEIASTGQYIENFRVLLDIENEIRDDSVEKQCILKNRSFSIAFSDVSFCYPGSEERVLKNINMTLESGDKYAIVGPNGAGKSTFIKLLLRLYDPTNGSISINGEDIKQFNYESYQSNFGVVFQDFQGYAFSLEENIMLGRTGTKNSVQSLLNFVGLKAKVDSFQNGLNTQLYKIFDEKGIELSGGELQKLAIAKALYNEPNILILDEPSSTLDPLAEIEILNKLFEGSMGKTTIFITHRLSSVKKADYIIFLEKGSIIEFGSHNELMDSRGSYYNFYHSQANLYQNHSEGDIA